MDKSLYVMIGGFLGAGKTTAILKLALRLKAQGLRVGLITNDQSVGLVDTALLGSHDFPVEEITGGCFCCRFNSLVQAAEKLSEENRPDVFLAEPVGSCTDLLATVAFPLRKIYCDAYRVAPLSVLVDPVRAERILGLAPGGSFSARVLYVYEKQLEEAEILVLNKCDLLSEDRQDRLEAALRQKFPNAEVLRVSARDGWGIEEWLNRLSTAGAAANEAPDIDYDEYAEGEALLGWLNVSLSIEAETELDGNELLRTVALKTRQALGGVEIAHLKMTLVPRDEGGDIGVLNLVRSDGSAELSHTLKAPLSAGELLVNLRAEADPELLRASLLGAIGASPWQVSIRHVEHFRPGRPEPTHRMAHA